MNVVALGFLPNKEVEVTTTASAAIFDVRTEFLYGLAEASARDSEYASVWGSGDAVDDLRLATEREAFKALVPEIEKTWVRIVAQHGGREIGIIYGGAESTGPVGVAAPAPDKPENG